MPADREPAHREPPDTKEDVRIPARIAVRVQFRRDDGSVLHEQVWPGYTRDVSETGLSLRVRSDARLLADLQQSSQRLRLDVDLVLGRKTVRVGGTSQWLRVSEADAGVCLAGVSYDEVEPRIIESVIRHARRTHNRPAVIRTAILVGCFAALFGGFFYWLAYVEHQAAVTELRQKLQDATQHKHETALELEQARRAMMQLQVDHEETARASRERQLVEVQEEYETLRDEVGELSVSLKDLEKPAKPAREKTARYHFERARIFAEEEDNLPAALIEYERTVQLDPTLAEAHLKIGTITDLFGRHARAVKGYKRYLELQPKTVYADEIQTRIDELEVYLASRKADGEDPD